MKTPLLIPIRQNKSEKSRQERVLKKKNSIEQLLQPLPPNFQEDNYFSSKLGLDKELAKLVTENLGEGGETDNGEIHDANAKFQSKNRSFVSMNTLPQTKKYKVTCS